MKRRRETHANMLDRLELELEHAIDVWSASHRTDMTLADAGIPLADFECRHNMIGACSQCAATETEAPYAV